MLHWYKKYLQLILVSAPMMHSSSYLSCLYYNFYSITLFTARAHLQKCVSLEKQKMQVRFASSLHWWYNFQQHPMFSFSCWKVYLRRWSNLHAETNIAKKMCMCLFHKWSIFYSFLPRSGIGVEAKCWTLRPGFEVKWQILTFLILWLEYFQHGSFMKFMSHHISS